MTETSSYLRDVSIPPRCLYTSEMSLYLDDLFFAGRNKCPRHNSEMSLNPRVSRVDFIPNSYPPNSLISEIDGNKRITFRLPLCTCYCEGRVYSTLQTFKPYHFFFQCRRQLCTAALCHHETVLSRQCI
jgi:hypothetical protein